MNKQIILNLPVKDLGKSKAFFSALDFAFDPRFSGENSAFMKIVEGAVQAMPVTEPFFIADRQTLADAKQAGEIVSFLS